MRTKTNANFKMNATATKRVAMWCANCAAAANAGFAGFAGGTLN